MPTGDVYDETVDGGRFRVRVVRDAPYPARSAVLTVTVEADGQELLRRPVRLYFGAPFGPDVADVDAWQHAALVAIDAYLVSVGESPPQPPVLEEGRDP